MLNYVLNTPLNCTLNLENNLGKNTNACVVRSSFFSKFKVFTSVFPKTIKPMRLPVCLTKIKFPFIFISPSIRVINRSAPLNPDVLFIKLSTTLFENLALLVRFFFFFNLLGCVHLLVEKCWHCVVPPKQKSIFLLHINKNE